MSRSARAAVLLVLLAAALAWPGGAGAHGRSTSTSSIAVEPGATPQARITLRASLSDLQRSIPMLGATAAPDGGLSPGSSRLVDDYLSSGLRLLAGGVPCERIGPVLPVAASDPTHVGRTWRVACAAPGPLVVELVAFFDARPGHLHLARTRIGDGPAAEGVLVLESPRLALGGGGDPEQAAAGFGSYLALGVEHILSGVDHVCFVLALLLVGATAWEVATIVTGFTAAHSVTLALGVLGVVRPEAVAVEALIGLSIVVVALENFMETSPSSTARRLRSGLTAFLVLAVGASLAGLLAVPPLALAGIGLFSLCYLALLGHVARPARLRWLVAFVFGLVHGFGFASVLSEAGLPPDRLARALVGFNLGVELGQLGLVALAWPPYHALLVRRPGLRPLCVQVGSAAVLAAGLYWFLGRSLGSA